MRSNPVIGNSQSWAEAQCERIRGTSRNSAGRRVWDVPGSPELRRKDTGKRVRAGEAKGHARRRGQTSLSTSWCPSCAT